ncbi:uncharacterized protein MKK02DRAFT_42797 [Dioszegia hungarica]|uniref:Uncharacterized protein n=1 Tax=Dioszegia hungarica TaxID=4972 RepID=A0AA38HE83_9TREE|nr:uncharacterized protein MKK02DRAFT_42797 [Dioszegia hungarica]KAI9638407.1 hypothetical protein MKK02DRAFT_42797 [Dioszegia hungarica]
MSSFRRWRQNFSVAGRHRSSPQAAVAPQSSLDHTAATPTGGPSDAYAELRPAPPSTNGHPPHPIVGDRQDGDGYEWEEDSEGEDMDVQPDAYSWVDPSLVGSANLRGIPAAHSTTHPLERIPSEQRPLRIPPTPPIPPSPRRRPSNAPRPPKLAPHDSYNLLLSFQSHNTNTTPPTSSMDHSSPYSPSIQRSNSTAEAYQSSDSHKRVVSVETEWYELVDQSVVDSLPKDEQRRQGLWWELIKAEREYVRDLATMCQGFVEPLRNHHPPILQPESRLDAFIAEVFSTIQTIYEGHTRLLAQLAERQRNEWPLLTSSTDLFLGVLLELMPAYEAYMKNYPFADSRVRREKGKNPAFKEFLSDRNTLELTQRRDVTVFLSRPVTRLPRTLLLLETLVKYTPADHPDTEELPTLIHVLAQAVKGSQPGIESAEAKIKLWNVAERLLFKKGEIVELDMGEPKRSLVYSGYVFRRVRSETAWHGWQDLHAFLLDNYFLLTRDEEHGKHVVVSRPIPLDFLHVVSFDAAPERRSDFMTQLRGGTYEPRTTPERLMWPFTISTSARGGGRSYTLCAGTEQGRAAWKDKIESAQILRRFDLESNRIFASHSISTPPDLRDPILSADAFSWLGRRTVAVATARSVYVGWRNDSTTFRELVRLQLGIISMVTIVPDFGWLLVVSSGNLLAFSLRDMMPASDPATWVMLGKVQAKFMSDPEKVVAFVRVGFTKGRLLVVHAAHSRNTSNTHLYFDEPLLVLSSSSTTNLASSQQLDKPPFRRFAQLTLPGHCTDLSFFRQTIAAVAEKQFVIAEPGNPAHTSIPTFPPDLSERAPVVRMINAHGAKSGALGMYQIKENEFLLVYTWGACYVTKYGEISRSGAYLRWNLTPSYALFRPPHILLFDESGGRAEVRDVQTGKMCEVVDLGGLKPVHLARVDAEVLGLTARGLVHLVETVEL